MKSIIKSIVIAMLFVFLQQVAFAQDAEKTVTLVVSGQGKTQYEAKQVALRSAIEQAFGTFISSKTEILNDQVVSDQIASVANGNIQSFTTLNESQLPNGAWGITLKAIVSVDKLTSFVEAKGVAIEIKGGMFALNIKQQILNEQSEIKVVNEMVGLLHETMQTSFDYVIKSGEPKSLDEESKNWEIPLIVTATANKNIDFCANYCIKTLGSLSLLPEEVTSFQSLNKAVFPVVLNYKGFANTFYLRKKSSINVLNTLINNWLFYTRLFIVQSGMDTSYGNGEGQIHDFSNSIYDYNQNIVLTINFLTSGQQAATFAWQDKRTLSQIEQMTGYKVKPRGVVSQFKHGGFVEQLEYGSTNVKKTYQKATSAPENGEILEFAEQMPEFPGGEEGLFAHIQKNLKYPKKAVDANTQGRVIINFVVNDDGSITDVKLARGIGYGCDEEAIRVVNSFPKWNPGKQNGKKVRVAYSLPITFSLD
jgi:TonB family protein